MAQKPESFEGIDFEAIKDATGLETDEIKVLKICFNMFDFKDQVRHQFFANPALSKINAYLPINF